MFSSHCTFSHSCTVTSLFPWLACCASWQRPAHSPHTSICSRSDPRIAQERSRLVTHRWPGRRGCVTLMSETSRCRGVVNLLAPRNHMKTAERTKASRFMFTSLLFISYTIGFLPSSFSSFPPPPRPPVLAPLAAPYYRAIYRS